MTASGMCYITQRDTRPDMQVGIKDVVMRGGTGGTLGCRWVLVRRWWRLVLILSRAYR